MKPFLRPLLLALAAATTASGAGAHGAPPAKHGGIAHVVRDLTFELVAGPGGAVLHVEDHGKPLATAAMSGKLTVLNGAAKSEAALKPVGDNRLEAPGVKLGPGAKAVATIDTGTAKKTVTVRFALK